MEFITSPPDYCAKAKNLGSDLPLVLETGFYSINLARMTTITCFEMWLKLQQGERYNKASVVTFITSNNFLTTEIDIYNSCINYSTHYYS